MNDIFQRTEMMVGADAMRRLQSCHVAVCGLGGVGSYAAEALCRAGVGRLTLVDSDTISPSNINRQLYALHSTVGLPKAEVAAQRCRDINPAVEVHPIIMTYAAETREQFFWSEFDYIVDAIDLVSCKIDLIMEAKRRNIPVLSALGTGNKLNAELLTVTDLAKTSGCPLARVMRRELRDRGVQHLKVCFSPEQAHETVQTEAPPPGRRSVPASVSWVPSVAGLLIAGAVVQDLLEELV